VDSKNSQLLNATGGGCQGRKGFSRMLMGEFRFSKWFLREMPEGGDSRLEEKGEGRLAGFKNRKEERKCH